MSRMSLKRRSWGIEVEDAGALGAPSLETVGG